MLTSITAEDLRRYGRAEAVAIRLRTAVSAGVLKPGERLTENWIATELGVSRTPVREAIDKLVSEGLLTHVPSRGLVVTELSRSQVLQIYSMRSVLEGAAAASAARHASPAEIEGLRTIHETLGKIKKPARMEIVNRDFHRAIYAAGHNEYLIQAASRLADVLGLLPGTTFSFEDRGAVSQKEHSRILDAIAKRDDKEAEARAREHMDNAQRIRLKLLFGSGE